MLIKGSRFKFGTDRINIFSINADSSGSMSPYSSDMRAGLKAYRDSFKNFSEANSMAVALNTFDSKYYTKPFRGVEDFDISYTPGGCTVLFGAIEDGARNLLDYINEVAKVAGSFPRATFVTLSDGEPQNDYGSEEGAMNAISALNKAHVTTVFVAFGSDITSEFGSRLGFQATKNVRDLKSLTEFMGEELSRSCKQQSKSMRSLGSEFFSKAAKSKSAGYDAKTSQVLEDEDWFNV